MERVLRKAIETAEKTQQPTQELFFKCSPNAAKKFLEQFFLSIEVLPELKKPLQDNSKPDVSVLVAAFERSAKQEPAIGDNYLSAFLRPWMERFVEIYFEPFEIPFRVAKWQYLEQLAQRVDDVKFVGIAVPGEEVEKQEVLAQIFVMPDVREEKSRRYPTLAPDLSYSSSPTFNLNVNERWLSKHKGIGFAQIISNNSSLRHQLNEQEQRNKLLNEQKEWAMRDRSAPRISAQKVINLAQKKAVILGAPGSGKTMLTSYFALMLCETPQSDPTQIGLEQDADYLPVVVRIRDWILQPKMGLLEYLRSNAEASLACKELPTGFFEHWLERGRALILLDGLDEVVDEAQRRKVAEQIETFLHQYQDNPAVITSRPAGYRWDFFNLDEFPHYTLESFDDKQVATFIDHWYDSRLKDDKEQAERRKADLQKAFARNERIRLLAKNPLLLTIITLIHRYGGELPKQRCELYEAAVKTLLIKWDSGKEIKRYEQDLIYLKQDDLLYILKKLAYWIHTKGSVGETEGGTIIKKNDLIGQLRKEIQARTKREFDEAEEEAKRFIDFIRQRTGLLNEQGQDRYAFVHKTFQEYLTAEEIYYLANREDDTNIILDHFRAHLHDQHWREVLLLLVSRLEGHKARKAIQTILDAKSEYEQWLHRDLLFAGWCLTEDPADLKDVAEDLVGEILDRLVEFEVGISLLIGRKISHEASKILHYFCETSVQLYVWEKLKAQESQIDIFRLLRFQTSLGQEAKAINTLISLLDDESPSVRYYTIETLGQLGNFSPEIVSSLLPLLSDRNLILRCRAVESLLQLGNNSQEVLSCLLSMLTDQNLTARSRALLSLGHLGSDASPEIISSLLSLLSDVNSDVRYSVVTAIAQLSTTKPAVRNELLSLLEDENLNVRFHVAEALVKLGNTSSVVVNSLLSLLSDEDSDVKSRALLLLGQAGNNHPEVVTGLLSLLVDKNLILQSRASVSLGHLGNASPEIVSSLLLLLDNSNSDVRLHAASALFQLGKASPEVISVLFSLLDNESSDVRSRAIAVLAQLAKTSDVILPKVVQWLERNPNHYGIGNAIDCLWSIVVE
jgi:HEAT repeat protein